MKNFVSYKWLEESLYKDNMIILDARGELSDPLAGQELYDAGHIPNAQFVSLEEVMTGELSEHGGRHPLPDIDRFVEDMKELGIDDESTVIIYDDGSLSFAGRLFWLLKYIGKDDVKVLKDGYNGWVRSGGDISESSPFIDKSENLTVNINDKIKVEMEHVRNSISKDGVALVDSRDHVRYSGESEPLDKIPGRIPSAINYPYDELISEDFPSIDEIKEHYKELQDKDEVILYCGSGVSATVNFMLMEEAGLEPKLYPGSFSDWISYEENEVESDFWLFYISINLINES